MRPESAESQVRRDESEEPVCVDCGFPADMWAGGVWICDACDDERAWDESLFDDNIGICKLGGPAPCIDDTCQGLNDCPLYYEPQP